MSNTAITIDLGVSLGQEITTKDGLKGRVTVIVIAEDGRKGVWIKLRDTTNRPFEEYVRDEEIGGPA